jgi:hypothetical protein
MPDLSEKEAADYLNRSPYTLRDWRERGVGPPYYRLVGSIVYSKAELDAFLESCRVDPKTSPMEINV